MIHNTNHDSANYEIKVRKSQNESIKIQIFVKIEFQSYDVFDMNTQGDITINCDYNFQYGISKTVSKLYQICYNSNRRRQI